MGSVRSLLRVCACALLVAACSSADTAATPDGGEDDATATTSVVETTTTEAAETTDTSDTTAAPVTTEPVTAEEATSDETVAEDTPDEQCGLSVLLSFDEGAPRDRVTITNQSTEAVSIATVEFDLSTSAGGIIFDTLDGGSGVEVFQDFQVESGEAVLTEAPVAEDGASSLRLDFTSFDPDQSFTFSIDVDDQLVDSDLGQIQVTGAELAGAEAAITTVDGATAVAVFDDADTAEYSASC